MLTRRLLVGLLLVAVGLRAHAAPPAQNSVAHLEAAPGRAELSEAFAVGSSFTLEGWFYFTAARPYAWVMGRGLDSAGADPYVGYALIMDESGTRPSLAVSTGAAGSYRSVTAPTAIALNRWVHLAGVMEGGALRLLVDGTVVATGSAAGATPSLPTVPFGLGVAYLPNLSTNYPALPAYARQVRVWNVARSSAAIQAAMASATPADPTGLVASWPLDEGSGSTARDTSGHGHALTTSGSWARTTVLESGPYFEPVVSASGSASLDSVDDAIVIDFDHDGDPDLLTLHIQVPPTVPETRRRIRAWRNTGGQFIEVTDAVLGDVTMVHPRDSFVGDVTGDGLADVVIAGHGTDTPPFPGEQLKLLVGTADGRLVDETSTRVPTALTFTHNLAVGDIDGDGDLDLYLANLFGGTLGPQIYVNDGTGHFAAATGRLPTDVANREGESFYASSRFADVDGDGDMDLVLGGENQTLRNRLLLNNGSGTFADAAADALPAKLFDGKSVTVAIQPVDLNADGAIDLVLSTTGGESTIADGRVIVGYGIPGVQLLLNRGDGTFYDASDRLNLTFGGADTWVEWIRVADVDADGHPDLVLQGAPNATGGFSRSVLLNRGAATFVDVSEAYAVSGLTALYPVDGDGDGRIDLLGVGNRIELAMSTGRLARSIFQATADQPGRLVNLSVRTQTGDGANTLTVGFALSGSGTAPMLVRAVGPTLASFGVGGTLADPRLAIAPLGGAEVANNEDWGGAPALVSAFTTVGAFPLASAESKDAAILFEPGAGPYTATVLPGGGVALVEAYAVDSTGPLALVNLSARAVAGTGDKVLVAGFSISGNVPRRLLIRAVGPTLAGFGVGGTLADPKMEVVPLGSSTPVAVNDNWGGTAALKASFTTVGGFPFRSDDSGDAAVLIELPPGGYTAVVSGADGGSGVALIEVYQVP